MIVKWGETDEEDCFVCGALGVDYAEFDEEVRSKCLTSVIIREQLGWKNRKGPLQSK